MTARAYFVHGVELVNCGADRCSACERPAIGFINAHPICARHAGMHAEIADELALEVEASKRRRESKTAVERDRVNAALARFTDHDTAKSTKSGRYRRINKAGNHAGAAAANSRKSAHQRGIRHAAILGAMQQLRTAQTSLSLALHTGLSVATVKRTVNELLHTRQLTAKRAHKSSAYLYSLRRAG
jgi:hypothetical protein